MKQHLIRAVLLALVLLLCGCSGGGAAGAYNLEEVSFTRDGQHIAGELYLPEGEEPRPLVILCHGYGGSMAHLRHYAVRFAQQGYAACVFDFIGGGSNIQSDGDMTEMSVLTEATDLNAVLDGLLNRPELDPARVFLLGASQGGFVVTYVAGQRPADIRGLIPLYPGYGMQDFVRLVADGQTGLQDTYTMLGQTVGRRYVEDALSFRIEDYMAAYDGPVLIVHGTADPVAPLPYSRRALQFFPSAELKTIEGAHHSFRDAEDEAAIAYMLDFLRNHAAD